MEIGIGDYVVSQNTIRSPFTRTPHSGDIFEGNIYLVRRKYTCSCGIIHIDIGLHDPLSTGNVCTNPIHFEDLNMNDSKSTAAYVKSNKCKKEEFKKRGNLISTDDSIWSYSTNFRKIDSPEEEIKSRKRENKLTTLFDH